MAGIDDVNRHPVIHTWSYKLAAVRYDSNQENADLANSHLPVTAISASVAAVKNSNPS